MSLSFFFSHNPTPYYRNGLGCSLSARRYLGNRFCFLFHSLLRCFSSRSFLSLFYEFKKRSLGWPIQESSDHSTCPASRSVSPVYAPFIVSECLGIHHKLFLSLSMSFYLFSINSNSFKNKTKSWEVWATQDLNLRPYEAFPTILAMTTPPYS